MAYGLRTRMKNFFNVLGGFRDRSNYKKTWDQLAQNYSGAKMFVAGYEDESQF